MVANRQTKCQLQDDYLDVYGDPAVFGKKIGGDILCGKKTFLLINAMKRADETQYREITALLADREMPDAEKIRRVTDLYNALGIPELTRTAIGRYYEAAHTELLRSGLDETRIRPLWQYAQSLLGRKS